MGAPNKNNMKSEQITKVEMEEAILDSLFKRKTPEEASKLDNKKKEVHIVTKKK